MLLTRITAAQNEDALMYDRVRGLCFLAVIFMTYNVIYVIQSVPAQMVKMRAEFASLNHCAVSF